MLKSQCLFPFFFFFFNFRKDQCQCAFWNILNQLLFLFIRFSFIFAKIQSVFNSVPNFNLKIVFLRFQQKTMHRMQIQNNLVWSKSISINLLDRLQFAIYLVISLVSFFLRHCKLLFGVLWLFGKQLRSLLFIHLGLFFFLWLNY